MQKICIFYISAIKLPNKKPIVMNNLRFLVLVLVIKGSMCQKVKPGMKVDKEIIDNSKESSSSEIERANRVFRPSMTNPLFKYPYFYRNLNRRFVLQYPYDRMSTNPLNKNDGPLKPLKASPELVLQVASASAALKNSVPVNPIDHLIQEESLRSGKYWDGFWKEDVIPDQLLRMNPQVNKPLEKSPEIELHELIEALRNVSPKLIYVIN